MEDLELLKKEAETNIKNLAKQEAENVSKTTLDEINVKFVSKEEAEKSTADFKKEMAELQARIKKMQSTSETEETVKAFNDYLADAINENADAIRNFKKGAGEMPITMKTVGNMSLASNFSGHTPFTQQVNQGLIWNPYNRVWLADLLPQATATGNSVIYPKENGGEGAAATWVSGDKALVDFDLTSQAAFFKWIAGVVIVDREMLDDISWLTSYLQQKLLISLKTAENGLILNGTSDTNPVTGLLAAATAYDGSYTALVEQIMDGAYGQIVEGTYDNYQPTTVVLNPRDAVAIGLNKASGSGEYDLPDGSANYVNGRLSIGGLDTVPTTSITSGEFIALDRNAVMVIRRMNPEIRLIEDAALARKNQVMFRIEERVTMAVFNNRALVTNHA